MAEPIRITLDTSQYRLPTEADISSAKQFVLLRNEKARELTNRIDDILLSAAERVTTIAYRHQVEPEDFYISSDYNEQLMNEISVVMDEIEDEILDLIYEYSTQVTEDQTKISMLAAWMATLGRGNRDLQTTLDGYLFKTMKDWEAAIAAMRYANLKLSSAITQIKTYLHHIYTMPEVVSAFKEASTFNATYIQSKGVMQGGVGLSNNGSTNVTRMADTTLKMVWMRGQAMQFEEDGAVGYYQLRGSAFNCDICDEETGFHQNIEEIYEKPFVHPNCCCYRVPVYANETHLIIE